MKNGPRKGRWLQWLWILVSVFLVLYSYTQIDLGMTLTSVSFWSGLQHSFQKLGYFNRPLSAGIYTGIILAAVLFYGMTLYRIVSGKLDRNAVWKIILTNAVILTASYPAFSKDFFNYLFTAKTVILYGKNPYLVTPLDFSGIDPWLGFLHWTHLPSAYTPLWIAVTLPLYALGAGIFPLTIMIFKIFFTGIYLATAFIVEQALLRVDKERAVLGLAAYALSPIVLIESIVSPHNDSLMALFAVLCYLLYQQKRFLSAYLALAASVGVKTMTGVLYPVLFLGFRRGWAVAALTVAVILAFIRKEPLGWYLLWIMPFVGIYPRTFTIVPGLLVSLTLLGRYVPYLYFGDYGDAMLVMRNAISVWGVVFLSIYIIWEIVRRVRARRFA